MYIKKLIVKLDGKITHNFNLNKGLSLICGGAEICDVIRSVSGCNEASCSFNNVSFEAVAELDKNYRIIGEKNAGEMQFSVAVYNEDRECTEEYFAAISQSEEMDSSLYFHRLVRQDFPHKLLRYKDLQKHYPDGNFAQLTNGYGTTRSFRAFLTDYIKNFKPILLREGKNYFLEISECGAFTVIDSDRNETADLSESETLLYHYLSFISIADFWDRAEKIRNMNRVKKPLVVSEFLERLDESVDITEILRRTDRLDRQTIIIAEDDKNVYNGIGLAKRL